LLNLALSKGLIYLYNHVFLPSIKLINADVYKFFQGGFFDFKEVKILPVMWQHAFSGFQASIGLKRLSDIKKQTEIRVKNVELIRNGYSGTVLHFPDSSKSAGNTYWQLIAYCAKPRNEISRYLRKVGIDTGAVLLPLCNELSDNSSYYTQTPVADKVKSAGIIIPAYPGLSHKQLLHILEQINRMG
jgi:dTDP-4-amino-4,6-dideoxygalactose transaminase